MKVWAKISLKEQNKNVDLFCKSFVNYLYGVGPINDICKKYNVSSEDRKIIDQYTANRIAGILMLYLANDKKRINDIVNKYNLDIGIIKTVLPEVEGYINK